MGLQHISCPGSYFSSVSLSVGEKIGSYASSQAPDQPALIFLLRTPCSPGAPTERDQHRAGRMELLQTPFETFETNIRSQLNEILGPGGFDAKRDIAAIAVNRWPHGYAYEYNPLYDSGRSARRAAARTGTQAFRKNCDRQLRLRGGRLHGLRDRTGAPRGQ